MRLGEVEENMSEEWLLKETIFFCRDCLRERIDDLSKLKRKVERAQESNPKLRALIQ